MTSQVEEIKSRLDIVEVISSYINLDNSGANLKARCPFHNEKTASFMVSKEKQIWHCFGCDKGGDIISFVEEYEGVDFKEAVKILAEKANIALKDFSASSQQKDYKDVYQINELATEFYCHNLEQADKASQKVKEYLADRKINQSSVSSWRLGLSGEAWDGLLKFLTAKGFKEQDIFQAGITVRKKDGNGYVDRFRKRLMFPLFDTQGRVVAFTSRTLNGIAYDEEDFGGKYINSPQSVIYDKSHLLYGWHLAKDSIRKNNYVIVVEGNMDVIAAHQAGTKNTVAVSGTALTTQHIKIIKRYTNNIILSFDGDAAGSRAAFRSISLCWQEDMNVKILLLKDSKDPADMVKNNPEAWVIAVKDSIPVMDYYFKRILAGVDLSRSDHKKIAVSKLLPIIKYLKSKVEQAHYLKLLSDKLQIPIELLKDDLGQAKSFLEEPTLTVSGNIKVKPDIKFIISENLLAISYYREIYFQKMMAEIDPEILAPEFRALYKKAIIYYTKHQHLDNFVDYPELDKQEKENWIKLSLLGEERYASLPELDLVSDFTSLLNRIRTQDLELKRQDLINKLRQLEISGTDDEQDSISHQINLINKEIHNLQS